MKKHVIYSAFMIVELETGYKKDETFSVLFYFIYFINKKIYNYGKVLTINGVVNNRILDCYIIVCTFMDF